MQDAEQLARTFHEAYERLAPDFGYATREASAKPWSDVHESNKRLMIATAQAVIDAGYEPPAPSAEDFLGIKPSAACDASMHHDCDGYFTWAGPTLCTCDCHE